MRNRRKTGKTCYCQWLPVATPMAEAMPLPTNTLTPAAAGGLPVLPVIGRRGGSSLIVFDFEDGSRLYCGVGRGGAAVTKAAWRAGAGALVDHAHLVGRD